MTGHKQSPRRSQHLKKYGCMSLLLCVPLWFPFRCQLFRGTGAAPCYQSCPEITVTFHRQSGSAQSFEAYVHPAESSHRAWPTILDMASRGQVRAFSRRPARPSDVHS